MSHECFDVYGLVAQVSNGGDPTGKVPAQVFKVLLRRLVLRVAHLDRSRVDQLRGQVLDLKQTCSDAKKTRILIIAGSLT